MRILHISRTMGQGGAEKIVYQLCADNHKQEQFVISTGGVFVKKLEEKAIKHFYMPDIDNKNPLVMIECLRIILHVVRTEKIDVLHSHHRMAAFYARWISLITGTKRVYTAHNVFFNRKKLMRFALKGSTVVAVGDGVKTNLEEIYGIPDENIHVIYNSIKIDAEGKKDSQLQELKNKGKCLVGTIGRLSEQKGVDVFVEAIAKSIQSHPEVMGIIVGDGENRSEIEAQIHNFGLDNQIAMLGYRSDVLDIIQQLDIVVLASRWEGLPLTPIEVFSQGKTIVATNISGNNEVVHDNENGLLVQKNSADEVADKVISLVEDRALKKRLELKAFETYRQKYQYESFIQQYNEVYKKSIEVK